jgi:hypothetical protein
MKLYNQYINQCKQHNALTDKEKAAIIYELVASDTRASAHYGIANGHSFDQFWLYTDIVNSAVLLQATKNTNGSIQLSIQGLSVVVENTPNFLDFFKPGEQQDFLKYLTWF